LTTTKDTEAQVQSELVAWFTEERKRLQDVADRYKAQLEELLAERAKAKKEYPGMVKELEAKRKALETLPGEIQELEGRVVRADMIRNDDETGSFSALKRTRDEFERAQYRAQSFVASKMDEMKRQMQA
jgi:hypothetical protein